MVDAGQGKPGTPGLQKMVADRMSADRIRFGQATIEVANRAEVTAHLVRCGYRVYRPEADIEGEDLVVRTPPSDQAPRGELLAVQLKPRVYVDGPRYSNRGLYMLFPIGAFAPDKPRPWYIVPHDALFEQVKAKHGHTPGWTGRWHNAHPSEALRAYLAGFEIRPPVEPESLAGAEDLD